MEKPVSLKPLASLILALGIVAGCWILGNAVVDFKAKDRFVTVKGLAEREVKANLAMWPISFSASADNLPALDVGLKDSRRKIMDFLKTKGLGSAEILDSAPRIQNNQANNYNNRAIPLYTAQGIVTVRSEDIGAIKKAMSEAGELVSAGVLLVRDYEFRPTFTFTNLNDIKPEMIAEATRNARDAAMQFAKDSGSHVGGIRSATQGYFSLQDRDQYTPEIKNIRVVTTVDYFLED